MGYVREEAHVHFIGPFEGLFLKPAFVQPAGESRYGRCHYRYQEKVENLCEGAEP